MGDGFYLKGHPSQRQLKDEVTIQECYCYLSYAYVQMWHFKWLNLYLFSQIQGLLFLSFLFGICFFNTDKTQKRSIFTQHFNSDQKRTNYFLKHTQIQTVYVKKWHTLEKRTIGTLGFNIKYWYLWYMCLFFSSLWSSFLTYMFAFLYLACPTKSKTNKLLWDSVFTICSH